MKTLEEPRIEKPPEVRALQPKSAAPPKPPETPGISRSRRYAVPSESSLWTFLPMSVVTLLTAAYVTARFVPIEEPVKEITVELSDIEGVKSEPPPLGEPNAPSDGLPPQPEPIPPPPDAESTPPPPLEKPEFELPEPAPTPRPKPLQEKPGSRPERTPSPKHTAAPAHAKPAAPRGVPNGKTASRGGSKGDFTATPHPKYDGVSLARRYHGVGEVLITYENGRISAVKMSRSTGVSYLDSRTTTWVRSRYKLKPGVSGKAKFTISWILPK